MAGHRIHTSVIVASLAAALVLGSADARNPGSAADSQSHGPSTSCTAAAHEQIRLRSPMAVDDIRVFVAPGSPDVGASQVRVETNHGDRVLAVRGDGSSRLLFQPALVSTTYDVSVDPIFSAPTSSCIERIELRSGGVVVAVVHP